MDTLSCIHGEKWDNEIGSRPGFKSYSCSIHVIIMTLVVGKDTD